MGDHQGIPLLCESGQQPVFLSYVLPSLQEQGRADADDGYPRFGLKIEEGSPGDNAAVAGPLWSQGLFLAPAGRRRVGAQSFFLLKQAGYICADHIVIFISLAIKRLTIH